MTTRTSAPGPFSYGRILLLGLGFFGISIAWSLYNAFVPLMLTDLGLALRWVGVVMILDNVAAVLIQPVISARSDRTWNRWGRRIPYILAGTPVAAACFLLLPWQQALALFIAIDVVYNIAMASFRAPTVALMPDLTPEERRSQANGIINLMGGLGALLAYFAGSTLWEMDHRLPFAATAALMVLIALVLKTFIREPDPSQVRGLSRGAEQPLPLLQALAEAARDRSHGTLWLLLAIFFWFAAFGVVETYYTLFGRNVLGLSDGAAAFSVGFVSLSFLVFAVPAGLLGARLGRRTTIFLGLGVMLGVYLVSHSLRDLWLTRVALAAGGLGWALVNVNSYPTVVAMTSASRIGAYTGLYYFFSAMAAIVAPPLYARIMEALGYEVMWWAAAVPLVLAAAMLLAVREPAQAGAEAGAAAGAGSGA